MISPMNHNSMYNALWFTDNFQDVMISNEGLGELRASSNIIQCFVKTVSDKLIPKHKVIQPWFVSSIV